MSNFLKELFHRRVPQVAAVYAGALWGVVQFSDFATSRYKLPERTVDWIFFGMLGLLPAVLLIAWNHGAPGRDRWSRAEVWFAAANLSVVMLALALLGPSGVQVKARSEPSSVSVEPASVAPRLSVENRPKLTKTLVFFFSNRVPEVEPSFASYALPALIQIDLAQDDLYYVETPLDGYQRPYISRLKRGGFESGVGASARLLSEIADDAGAQYFVTGSFEKVLAGYSGEVEIYSATPARLKRRTKVEAADLAALADEMTIHIRNALNDPAASDARISDDLPVASLVSEKPAAIAAWGEGLSAQAIRNDSAATIAAFTRATTLDKTFAIAQLALTEALFASGQQPLALRAARAAQAVQYRLSDSMQYALRSYIAALSGRHEEAAKILEAWTLTRPLDIPAKTALAFTYLTSQNKPKLALAEFEAIAALDPGNPWAGPLAVRLQRQLGNDQAALALQKKFAQVSPKKPSAWIELADLQWQMGEVDGARASFERGLRLRGDVVSPNLSYAYFLTQQGDFEHARTLIEDAKQIAADPQQRALVVNADLNFRLARGDASGATALLPELIAEYRKFLNTYEFNSVLAPFAAVVARAQGIEAARSWIGTTLVSPDPQDKTHRLIVAIAVTYAALEQRQIEPIDAALKDLRTLGELDQSGVSAFNRPLLSQAQALLDELNGRNKAALEGYLQSRELFRQATGALRQPLIMEIELGVAIARCARLSGDQRLAQTELQRVIKLAPKAREVLAEIADSQGEKAG